MKFKFKSIFLLAVSAFMLMGCNMTPLDKDDFETFPDPFLNSTEEKTEVDFKTLPIKKANEAEEEFVYPELIIIHYHNDDGENTRYPRQFYLWNISEDGEAYDADQDITATDMKITIDVGNPESKYHRFYGGGTDISFIIKRKGTWDGQSEDTILDFLKFKPDADGKVEVWCIPGTGQAVEIYATEAETKLDKVTNSYFTDWKTIHAEATVAPKGWALYAYEETYLRSSVNVQTRDKEKFKFKSGTTPSCTQVRHFAAVLDGQVTEDWVTYDLCSEEEKKAYELIVNYWAYEFDIKLNYNAHLNVKYVLETTYESHNKTQIHQPTFDKLYETVPFEKYYYYDGKLGCQYTPEATTFRVWAPTSAYAVVNLYPFGTPKSLGGDDSRVSAPMHYKKGGVWEVTVTNQDLKGYYYTYQVTNSNGTVEVCDPYATSAGVNGIRGYIYDKKESEPDNWDQIPLKWDGVSGYDIDTPQRLSIYEVCIPDLTKDDTWTGSEKPGTYNAFCESGTTYSNGGTTVTTGYDHLVELGPKALQLIPVFDQSNDELDDESFNWGYNPLNYNVPEGKYSSNPEDGMARVKEFKNMIAKFATNSRHQRIIMDVVYNHVGGAPASAFTKLMPRYYFRMDKYYRYENGSGCSNENKTEAPMMRKFIVESVCQWATEYKIKGFRFDLMGLIDVFTMKAIKEALYEIDPDIVVYGEGWTSIAGYHGTTEGGNGSCTTKACYEQLYESEASKGAVGAFNDAGRNSIRGGNDQGWGSPTRLPGWGFISQSSTDVQNKSTAVGEMLRGCYAWEDGNVVYATPKQCINYASCHDNFTLFDQLNWTLSEDGGITEPDISNVCKGVTAVEGAILASNGVAFFQGGEELFRTKIEDHPEKSRENEDYVYMYGKAISHNSYKSSFECNSFKWDRKISIGGHDTTSYFNFLKSMFKLRDELPFVGGNPGPNTDGDLNMNYWNHGDASTLIGFHLGSYCFYLNGRTSGNGTCGTGAPVGGLSNSLAYNVPLSNFDYDNYVLTMKSKYSFIAYKI